MSAFHRAEPYSLLAMRPAELLKVLEALNAAGVRTGDRAMLLSVLALTDPRTNVAHCSAFEVRRLAGEKNPRPIGGGGSMSGGLWRLQAQGLLVRVPHTAGGGWMVNPLLASTAGSPEALKRKWKRFRAMLIANTPEQQSPEPAAAAA